MPYLFNANTKKRSFVPPKSGHGCNISTAYGKNNFLLNKYKKTRSKPSHSKRATGGNALTPQDRAFLKSLGLKVLK